jgi:tRNA(Ser,Leu) C12 N-acetylase TAN1
VEWNILAAAFMRKERSLLNLLRNYGEFKGSGYRDVVLGRVEDVSGFLETMDSLRRERPGKLRPLSQIVPLEMTFEFDLDDFREKLRDALTPYVERIEQGCRFYVRVKRRGHKGEISSLEVEQEMAGFLLEELERRGIQAEISFEDPDKFIIVETAGNRAGVGLITREMRERYSFIRVK